VVFDGSGGIACAAVLHRSNLNSKIESTHMEHMEGYWESIFGAQKDLGSVGDAFIDMFKFGLIVALVGTLIGAAFGFGWACLGLLTGALAGGWFGLDRYSDRSIRSKLARAFSRRAG
jgi:hypothetical protein